MVDIARRYLGVEPVLWLTQLRWSFGDPVEQRRVLSSLHAEPVQYDSDAFHYDTLDFKSLTIFIYLTDVGPDSGPHVVIENTHKTKSFGEICHIILSDSMAQKESGWPDSDRFLLPRGFNCFEETHRLSQGGQVPNQSIDVVDRLCSSAHTASGTPRVFRPL